ncbi:hypothetical protein ACQEUU_37285 [Nonomuraea sp. CA-218870]|uniref:hypothetical protein n=1 Tax=Nonomuraea sp. CA-218870 TaxID=3239998 RepID=UPI003D8A837E
MVSDDAYEALRRDVQAMYARVGEALAALRPTSPDPRDEQIDAQRLEIARLRAIVTRIIYIPREPHASEQEGELGRAYLRGWQSVRALIDKALLPEEEQG